MANSTSNLKLGPGEKAIGVVIGLGTGIVTAVGVVLPVLEFIVGGVGGVTGLGITMSGLGTILTMALGGLVAFAVGGVAAYMAYKSYVETEKELKKDQDDASKSADAAKDKLITEMYEYYKAMMRLYMMENPQDEIIDKEKMDKIIDKNLPELIGKRARARENLKKLFADTGSVSVINEINTNRNSYNLLFNSFRGIDAQDQTELSNQEDKIKNVIKSFYKENYKEEIKPRPANPSYLLDGLIGGITGFVGVLGISSSVTTIAMGLSFSLAFGFLITNPVGWGIIGLAVAAGIAAGVTYGYMQYKNAKRKELVNATEEKANQLEAECGAVNKKTAEITRRLNELNAIKQARENEEKLKRAEQKAQEKQESLKRAEQEAKDKAKKAIDLAIAKITIAAQQQKIDALQQQLDKAPTRRHQRSLSSSGALGLFGKTETVRNVVITSGQPDVPVAPATLKQANNQVI